MRSTATSWRGKIVDEVGNILLQPPLGGLGRARTHGSRTDLRVALTFDDGPNTPSTAALLDLLDTYHVKATFFCVGVNAAQTPHLVERAYNEGHVIGNHSQRHSRKAGLLWREDAHIDDCARILTGIIGVEPRLYRPPWGWLTPWETRRLVARKYAMIGWDVYTYDWQVPPQDGDAIAAQVARDVRPGSIILFHDGIAGVAMAEKPNTLRAVELTIQNLAAKGIACVTIPDLLGIAAYRTAPVLHEHLHTTIPIAGTQDATFARTAQGGEPAL